jgi:hypothetical protein
MTLGDLENGVEAGYLEDFSNVRIEVDEPQTLTRIHQALLRRKQ